MEKTKAQLRTCRHSSLRIQAEEQKDCVRKCASKDARLMVRTLKERLRYDLRKLHRAQQDFIAPLVDVHRAFCAACAKDLDCMELQSLRSRLRAVYLKSIDDGLHQAISEALENHVDDV